MARRILCFGLGAEHRRITNLASFEDRVSVTNYDAFAFDPNVLRDEGVIDGAAFFRRQCEIRDLVRRKGGLVLCVLRPELRVHTLTAGILNVLDLLDLADQRAGIVKASLRLGTATNWGYVKGAEGVTCNFVRALAQHLRPEAFLEEEEGPLRLRDVTVIAANSAGWPVSFEFVSGLGRICFVPVPLPDVPDGQLGAAIARMVEEHFGGPAEIETPDWVGAVSVPGADAHNIRIAELEKRAEEISEELSRLDGKRSQLLNFKVLLYGSGRSVLEPVVRRALRELGFKVLEPEEYDGEWDVDLTDEETGRSAVGEVEGSEGAINVDKLRQLLDYVEAEENEGRNRKGVLIGNGYRLKRLDEPERSEQFTEMAVRRAGRYEYCLLPTAELFAAVCATLKAPEDGALKKRVRDSIVSTVGVWKFTADVEFGGRASADSPGTHASQR